MVDIRAAYTVKGGIDGIQWTCKERVAQREHHFVNPRSKEEIRNNRFPNTGY